MKNNTNIGAHTPSEQENNSDTSLINKEDEIGWGKHPNSLKAIEPYQFPKGVSGNPLGRKPSFEGLKKNLDRLGAMETFNWQKESEGSRKEQVLKKIWKKAIGGDEKMIQLLAWLGCLE